MEGWIKLHRQIQEWERYGDFFVRGFFIHCLLKANHRDGKWKGIDVKKGQFISSYEILARENGLSVRSVRTIINKLKSTSELTSESTSKYTLFTIVKYSDYQEHKNKNDKQIDTHIDEPPTNDRQTTDKQTTTNKNDNNNKNEEEGEENNNTSLSTIDGDAEPNKKEISKKIDSLIESIKRTAFENGLAYIRDSERNFAKHILTAKEYGQFCEAVGMSREQFAIATMLVSVKIKYFKGPATGPKKIYQNYAEIYNKGKQEFDSNKIVDLSIYLPSDQ